MQRKIVYPDAEESIAGLFNQQRLARLQSLGEFQLYCGETPDEDTMIQRSQGAQAILSGWGMSNAVLAALPELEVISFTGLGASTFIDLSETRRRNITVTHTLSAASTIAEHTMALMLDVARHISRLDRGMRNGIWRGDLPGVDLNGKTLGLIGFGRIARAVVPLAQVFGMEIVSWTRRPELYRENYQTVEFIELDDLLGRSDVISLHLLSTPETLGLLDAKKLDLLKPGALLINTARSQILDEKALADRLESGHIAAAGIDVFDQEPLHPGHAYHQLENIVMTPHVAYNTPAALDEMYDTAIDNLVAYFAGHPQNIA